MKFMDYTDIINSQEEERCSLAEPSARNLLLLRKRVVELVNKTTDEEGLYECLSVLDTNHANSRRSDITRAISGEEVMNRLRPRLKGLFT